MLGFRVKIAENECRAIGMFELFSEDGSEDSVGFGGCLFTGCTSCVAVGVVGSWIQDVVQVEVSHV